MTSNRITDLADIAELLARRALEFGEIDRTAVRHRDGRPETDATHTVMLAWLAPALASLLYPDLDPLLVAAFAAVHDAVEVFAGDTPTLRITEAGRAAKRSRELIAAGRWCDEFANGLPWLPVMIIRYEAQDEPEARFTRAIDKILPGLVHALTEARDLAGYGITAAEQDERRRHHRAEMASYAADFPAILDLRGEVSARLATMLRKLESQEIAERTA